VHSKPHRPPATPSLYLASPARCTSHLIVVRAVPSAKISALPIEPHTLVVALCLRLFQSVCWARTSLPVCCCCQPAHHVPKGRPCCAPHRRPAAACSQSVAGLRLRCPTHHRAPPHSLASFTECHSPTTHSSQAGMAVGSSGSSSPPAPHTPKPPPSPPPARSAPHASPCFAAHVCIASQSKNLLKNLGCV
jgi:hypothetical protein